MTEAELIASCREAAYSAGEVHDWLEPLLSKMVRKERYTFKGRKKGMTGILSKVHARRNSGDAEFGPHDVTDASGFRIVELLNREVPEALDLLLTKLNGPLEAGEVNGRLAAVREIEFHTSRPITDPLSIYRRVEGIVAKHGRVLKPPKPGRDSTYSSVHVLLDCEVGSGASTCRACSEIQLRSVFEEAWSEISHRVRYAPTKAARAQLGGSMEQNESLTDLFWHLDALKAITDGCAQYADVIDLQLSRLYAVNEKREVTAVDPAEQSASLFRKCGEALFAKAREAYRLRSQAQNDSVNRKALYQKAANLFRVLHESICELPEAQLFTDLNYRAEEEFAFCLMGAGGESRVEAEIIYRRLHELMPSKPSIKLRLGQLRRDALDYEEARTLMREGLQVVGKEEPFSKPLLDFLLRRDLAYIDWAMVDRDRKRPDALDLLYEATHLSEEAIEYAPDLERKLSAALNLLYYLCDIHDLSPDDQRVGISRQGTGATDPAMSHRRHKRLVN